MNDDKLDYMQINCSMATIPQELSQTQLVCYMQSSGLLPPLHLLSSATATLMVRYNSLVTTVSYKANSAHWSKYTIVKLEVN